MKVNNEKGYTLVTVLLVVLLLTILGGAYILAMNFEVRESYRHDNRVQAYYLARSGAETASDWLIENQNNFLKVDNGKVVVKESSNGEPFELENLNAHFSSQERNIPLVTVDIDFREVTSKEEIIIKSIGNYGGAEETVILVMKPVGPFDNAVYTNSPIDATKRKPTIKGDVQSGGEIEGTDENIDGTIKPNSPLEYDLPEFPNDLPPKLNLQVSNDEDLFGNGEYNQIKITAGKTLTINTGSDDSLETGNYSEDSSVTEIMVETLTGLGTLDTICQCENADDFCDDCAVILYITGDSELQTPSGGNQVPIFVYLADGVTLTLRAGSKFNGYIYGPGATIAMASVGPDQEEPDIFGAIIVNELQRNSNQADFDGLIEFGEHPNLLKKVDLSLHYNKLTRGLWK